MHGHVHSMFWGCSDVVPRSLDITSKSIQLTSVLGALANDARVRDQGGGAPWKGSGVEKGVDGKRGQGAGTLLPKWETLEVRGGTPRGCA